MNLFWNIIQKRPFYSKCASNWDILCRYKVTHSFKCSRTFCEKPVTRCHQYEVLVSTSDKIYTNLALEEWLYKNRDLTKSSVLLLWKNKPCVVIGRHQNPWLECNVPDAVAMAVDVVRRGSGGGAVYHDEGNLNCAFIADRCRYDRRRNLDFVISAIKTRWDIDLEVNSRDDIILDKMYKVSGSASRLTRNKTFHHFTLLYKADTEKLQRFLRSSFGTGVHSKATPSLSSQVRNMSDYAPDMDFTSLVQVIGQRFLSNGFDQNMDPERIGEIQYVDPTDRTDFPGIEKLQSNLENWEWIYGKTPKFSLKKNFSRVFNGTELSVTIDTEINKGRIIHIDISCHGHLVGEVTTDVRDVFIGQRFWPADLDVLVTKLKQDGRAGYHGNENIFNWILCCLRDTLNL